MGIVANAVIGQTIEKILETLLLSLTKLVGKFSFLRLYQPDWQTVRVIFSRSLHFLTVSLETHSPFQNQPKG